MRGMATQALPLREKPGMPAAAGKISSSGFENDVTGWPAASVISRRIAWPPTKFAVPAGAASSVTVTGLEKARAGQLSDVPPIVAVPAAVGVALTTAAGGVTGAGALTAIVCVARPSP